MAVEISGIKITDESQAQAMFTQGFLSNEELLEVLKDLNSKPFLARIADDTNLNKPKTVVGIIIKRIEQKLKRVSYSCP